MLRYKHLVVNKTYTQTVNANTGYRTGDFELTINLEVVHPDHLVVGQANGEAYHEMLTLIDQIVEVVLPNQTVARIASPISIGGSLDRKSTRLNSSHVRISYAVFCLKNTRPISNGLLERS